MWLATERSYRGAAEQLIQVRANKAVQAREEDESPDFTREAPVRHLQATLELNWQRRAWEDRIRRMSSLFRSRPEIEDSYVTLDVTVGNRYFVSTERSVLQTPSVQAAVSFGAYLTADDGMVLSRDDAIYAHTLEGLPSEEVLRRRIKDMIADLTALRVAPQGDPYVGPALLDGLAAAVLFHEVLGHRAEGHRQRMQWEGKTFKKMIGQRVMPHGFDVFDDPRALSINGMPVNGTYLYDDEGVAGERVTLVEDGIFRGFLMSRMPIEGFSRSNGHGRRQLGRQAVSRQSNLVMSPKRVTTPSALKQALIAEVRRQGRPYGLRVSRVTGGETQTGTYDPQAFQVEPILVYKVFPDGRETLVRGVRLEGTPLSMLSNVIAASNDFAVFNGLCGAESGQVPVSAVSPGLLISKIEVARAPKSTDRPPLLPPPVAPVEEVAR
jgi:predicted Zn-dependent protease